MGRGVGEKNKERNAKFEIVDGSDLKVVDLICSQKN